MNSNRRSPLILVVDDDPTTNRMIADILNQVGFQAASASDIVSAWPKSHERPPNLVLLDMNLPDGSGFDVCRRLQREPETTHTPVLFISVNEYLVSMVKGFAAGGVDYIPKPLAELQAEPNQRLASAQETLIPQLADIPAARFFISFNPMLSMGEDFLNVVLVGGEVVDYVVADAIEHDLATASLKTLLSEYATPINTPRDLLRAINAAMCRILSVGVFLTIIHARLKRQWGRLTLANAGHPPTIIARKIEGPPCIMAQEGDIMGAFPGANFDVLELKLKRGDRFFLFSDGLIELNGNREDGLMWLKTASIGDHARTGGNVRARLQRQRSEPRPRTPRCCWGGSMIRRSSSSAAQISFLRCGVGCHSDLTNTFEPMKNTPPTRTETNLSFCESQGEPLSPLGRRSS